MKNFTLFVFVNQGNFRYRHLPRSSNNNKPFLDCLTYIFFFTNIEEGTDKFKNLCSSCAAFFQQSTANFITCNKRSFFDGKIQMRTANKTSVRHVVILNCIHLLKASLK